MGSCQSSLAASRGSPAPAQLGSISAGKAAGLHKGRQGGGCFWSGGLQQPPGKGSACPACPQEGMCPAPGSGCAVGAATQRCSYLHRHPAAGQDQAVLL